MKYLLLGLLLLSGCGSGLNNRGNDLPPGASLPPVGVVGEDDVVVHGRAIVNVSTEQDSGIAWLVNKFLLPKAYAATGSVVVTYNNVASTNFSINAVGLVPSGFTGDTLSLGTVSLATLNDNHLKVCTPGGNTKCTQSAIRVYTTGLVAGFVHTDGYGAPIFAGNLNPSTPVGLLAAGSVQTQTLAIPGNKHKVVLADYPTPNYAVSSDFSNAGSGSYSATLVIEYVLLP